MNVSKNEAAEALAVIARSGDQMQTLRRYAHLAPFLLVWGAGVGCSKRRHGLHAGLV